MRLTPRAGGLQVPLVQLAARLHRSLKLFRRITGLSAVTSVATPVTDADSPLDLSPPLHPRCARRLRSLPDSPCAEQWRIHGRLMRRSSRANSHTCPAGLRCSCVPIHFEGRLVGVAKLVADATAPDRTFETAVNLLELITSQASQGLAVTALSEEVLALREDVLNLRQSRTGERLQEKPLRLPSPRGAALVERALAYLQLRYPDRELSLRSVASTLGCNPKYLTTRFTEVVGEHMHAYLIKLRVSHARRLLIATDDSVKSLAYSTGFAGPGHLANAFRTHVGVSPREYRRIYSTP